MKKRIACDLDGILCVGIPYREARPLAYNIALINQLAKNFQVIIYTARQERDRKLTLQWLRKNGVKYHKLVMSKVRADYYIDDKNINIEEIAGQGK